MEWLSDFFSGFFADLYQLAVQFSAWITVKLTIAWFETKIFLITFSWDVAKEILVNVHFAEVLSGYFNQLPPSMRSLLLYLQIDKGIAIISQAFVAGFFFSRVGF